MGIPQVATTSAGMCDVDIRSVRTLECDIAVHVERFMCFCLCLGYIQLYCTVWREFTVERVHGPNHSRVDNANTTCKLKFGLVCLLLPGFQTGFLVWGGRGENW